jgi:hypothetical protein
MARNNKGPSWERQLQIMKERGLLISKKPVIQKDKTEIQAFDCPCKKEPYTTGRHKFENEDWCIDGGYWKSGDIQQLRVLKINCKTEQGYKQMVNALSIIKKHMTAEIESIFHIE